MAPDMLMGYPTFVVSIFGIGLLTAVIGDLASQLGCTISLKDSITAIGFVALGTSVPGTNKEMRKIEDIALTLEVVALVRVVVNMFNFLHCFNRTSPRHPSFPPDDATQVYGTAP